MTLQYTIVSITLRLLYWCAKHGTITKLPPLKIYYLTVTRSTLSSSIFKVNIYITQEISKLPHEISVILPNILSPPQASRGSPWLLGFRARQSQGDACIYEARRIYYIAISF